MGLLKKVVAAVGAAVASAPVFAQEGGSVSVDVSAANDAVNAVGTAISGVLKGSVMTNILLVVGAGLAIAVVFLGIRYLMRGGKTAAR